jgi:hypothetical protein
MKLNQGVASFLLLGAAITVPVLQGCSGPAGSSADKVATTSAALGTTTTFTINGNSTGSTADLGVGPHCSGSACPMVTLPTADYGLAAFLEWSGVIMASSSDYLYIGVNSSTGYYRVFYSNNEANTWTIKTTDVSFESNLGWTATQVNNANTYSNPYTSNSMADSTPVTPENACVWAGTAGAFSEVGSSGSFQASYVSSSPANPPASSYSNIFAVSLNTITTYAWCTSSAATEPATTNMNAQSGDQLGGVACADNETWFDPTSSHWGYLSGVGTPGLVTSTITWDTTVSDANHGSPSVDTYNATGTSTANACYNEF